MTSQRTRCARNGGTYIREFDGVIVRVPVNDGSAAQQARRVLLQLKGQMADKALPACTMATYTVIETVSSCLTVAHTLNDTQDYI